MNGVFGEVAADCLFTDFSFVVVLIELMSFSCFFSFCSWGLSTFFEASASEDSKFWHFSISGLRGLEMTPLLFTFSLFWRESIIWFLHWTKPPLMNMFFALAIPFSFFRLSRSAVSLSFSFGFCWSGSGSGFRVCSRSAGFSFFR